MLGILAIDGFIAMCYANANEEIGELCLLDVISFKVFHNVLGLLLFFDIRFK